MARIFLHVSAEHYPERLVSAKHLIKFRSSTMLMRKLVG